MDTPFSGNPSGGLLHNLLLFGRLLRGLGLDVNPGRMIDLVRALDYIDIGRKGDFYHTMRALLVHQREDIVLFDEAFEAFWRKHAEGWTTLDLRALGEKRRFRRPTFAPPPLQDAGVEQPNDNGDSSADDPPQIQLTLTYSEREVLRHKDFADLTGEELEQIYRMMGSLIWQVGQRRTRRSRPGHGRTVDFRHTLRHNLRYGGEMLDLAYREPKYKPRPLVIIADISGSMERYTRLLLHFIYGITERGDQRVEGFLFGTRLTRITRQVRSRDVDHAMREVSRVVPDWSGGTRIGDALKTFNFAWGRRVLGGGAVVLLISDGWDRGDVDLLSVEMARLQRSCYQLIWLNPLLSSPDYEPISRGMHAALPFVDHFLPVHNLASLEDLSIHLRRLGKGSRS